jgi:hypothetical protein
MSQVRPAQMLRTLDVHNLFLLNICLQMFDGVATYLGILGGAAEGNPIVAAAMTHLGLGTALLLFKAKACGCLVLLRRLGDTPLAVLALAGVAVVYVTCSFVPWLVQLWALA